MDEWELAKSGPRGSGRKGVATSKPRQKRNCSARNHGCHGYFNEKSWQKAKGRAKRGYGRYAVDAGDGFEVFFLSKTRSNKMVTGKMRDSRSYW